MAAKKTTERRAAELISKSEGIKLKSAYRRIQRAARADKPVKAAGLSKYGQQLLRSVEREKRAGAKRPAATRKPVSKRPQPVGAGRVKFRYEGKRVIKMRVAAEFGSSGSGDRRLRWVREEIDAETANRILNAESVDAAIEEFNRSLTYMKIANVDEFHQIEFNGETYRSFHFQDEGEDFI